MIRRIALGSILVLTLALAATDRQSTDPYLYGSSARSLGMGRTSVASAYDSHGLFSNPAAIAKTEKMQFGITSFKLMDEYSYLGLSSAYQTDFGVIGLSYMSMGVQDIPQTDINQEGSEFRVIQVGSYSMGDRVIGITYATSAPLDLGVLKNPSLGVTGKLAQSYISGTTNDNDKVLSGFGVDVGARADLNLYIISDVQVGLAMINVLSPRFTSGSGTGSDSVYPTMLRTGVSKAFSLMGQTLIAAADVDALGNHMGVEYVLDKSFMVRAGMDSDSNTFGLGYKIFSFYGFDGNPYTFALDYAYHQYPQPLQNLHLFSVSLLGASKTKRPTLIAPVVAGSVISQNSVTFQGSAEPDTEVSVLVNNRVRKILRTSASGVWIAKDVYLDDGRNDVYCTAQANNAMMSDPSDTISFQSDQKPVELRTTVAKQLGNILVHAVVNKPVRAVVSKFPDGSRLSLQFDGQEQIWIGTWAVPAAYSNTYVKVQTIAVDFSGNRSAIAEDYISTKIITYPNDRTVTTQKQVTVKGQVQPSVRKVRLGSLEVSPDAKGYFQMTTTLNTVGKNVLALTSIDDVGTVVTSSVRVLRIDESTDIDQAPQARREIASLLTLGFLKTDEAQEFKPREFMSREEFARALAVIRGLSLSDDTVPADVDKQNVYAPAISAVLKSGYLALTTEGLFKPASYIQRKDAITAIVKMDELDMSTIDNRKLFADVPPYMPFAPYIAAAVKAGIIQPAEQLNPDQEITKEEAARLLARSKYALKKIEALYDWNSGYGAQFESQPTDTDFGVNDAPLSFDKTERLKVVAPDLESQSTTKSLMVKGYCVSDNVTINGVTVAVKKQRFAAELALKPGKNYIVIDGADDRVILKVIFMQRFADIPEEALAYNTLAQYGALENNTFARSAPLQRTEFYQIMAGLAAQQYVPPTENKDVVWGEALPVVNVYDGKEPKATSLVNDLKQYKPDTVMTHDDLVQVLEKTERYQKQILGKTDFKNFSPDDYKPDRVNDRGDLVSKGGSDAAFGFQTNARTEDDEYISFLKRFDQKEFLHQKKIDRTGESIVAGGKTEFEITYPENDFVASDEIITVTGIASAGETLKINGQVVQPDTNNKFKQPVTLRIGKNIIAIKYADEDYKLTGVRLISYQDIAGYREKKGIQYLATAGYFRAGQRFDPEQAISREEYVALLVRMTHETPVQTFQNPYPDVDSRRWSASSIQMLKSMKILPENGNFNPEATMTQKEAAAWFTKASKDPLPEIDEDKPLRRVDIVRWLIKDSRVQRDLNELRS